MLTTEQAKHILLLYRPNSPDTPDPEMREALELARQDPELAKWFGQHQAFQASVRAKLRQVEPPAQLKQALLASHKIIRPQFFWPRPAWLAAAAIFVVLVGLARLFLSPSVPDRFGDYRETMVSAAVRVYGMDLETSDASRLRRFIAAKGAPADYQLTPGLERLQLQGGGLLRWRGNPVSMICFDRGGNRMVFLFVLKRSALKDPPPQSAAGAELQRVEGLITASWTRGTDSYLLAGPEEPGFAEKYLRP